MEEMHPELKDILEMIKRYNATHNAGCFVFNFIGFKNSLENNCDCGIDCCQVDNNKSMIGAFGDLEVLRIIINDLRDIVEDSVDEEGIVNV